MIFVRVKIKVTKRFYHRRTLLCALTCPTAVKAGQSVGWYLRATAVGKSVCRVVSAFVNTRATI